MSNKFRKFSDAARLYAEHSAVVDKMYEIFEAESSSFLNAVREGVQSRIGNLKFEEGGGKGANRSWYLWSDAEGTDEDYDVPYLWFTAWDPRIVIPGLLELQVRADGELRPHQEQLATSLFNIPLPKTCTKDRGKGGCLFTVTISFNGEESPVDVVTEPLLTLLTAMWEALAKLRKQSQSSENRPLKQVK
jgi:hypothetical protein